VNKKHKILFFCMIFVNTAALTQPAVARKNNLLLAQCHYKGGLNAPIIANKLAANSASLAPVLSPDFYARQLGFFCQQELKFDRITRFPVRLRLGSLDDCDRLEGKKRW
jgi:hypothetical protein